MIVCEFSRVNGNIESVSTQGHSGYDDRGLDIVCAAVSTLMISAVNGLTEYANINVKYTIDDDGFIQFELPKLSDERLLLQANAILETLYLGIVSIAAEYEEYMKVID